MNVVEMSEPLFVGIMMFCALMGICAIVPCLKEWYTAGRIDADADWITAAESGGGYVRRGSETYFVTCETCLDDYEALDPTPLPDTDPDIRLR